MNYINLTGHEVHNLSSGLRIPAGKVLRARCETTSQVIDGNVVHETQVQEVNLPKPIEDTIYIVSALVMSSVPAERKDVWCPKQVVRDKRGRIIGCKDFRRKES